MNGPVAEDRLATARARAEAAWRRTRAWIERLELDRRISHAAATARRDGAALARGAAERVSPLVERARDRLTPPPPAAPPRPDPALAAMLARDGLPEGERSQADPPRPRRPAPPAPLFGDLPEQPAPVRLPPAEVAQAGGPRERVETPRVGEWWRALPERERMTMAGFGGLFAGALLIAGLGQAADPERARIERIVHDYLLEHPEIIPQAIARLRTQEEARAIVGQRRAIETPFEGAWAGNPNGDVTLVEFFDYACGYCRQSVKDVERLLAEDRGLKVVFRELPVLGEASDEAARVSLSAAKQGKFLAFHRALYSGPRLSAAALNEARTKAGLDPAQVNADVQGADTRAEVETNLSIGQTLGINGTPSFIVGDQLLGGAVGYDALKAAIAKVRAAR